jgi:hypothetical protein
MKPGQCYLARFFRSSGALGPQRAATTLDPRVRGDDAAVSNRGAAFGGPLLDI